MFRLAWGWGDLAFWQRDFVSGADRIAWVRAHINLFYAGFLGKIEF
jgi:hypothetical protein